MKQNNYLVNFILSIAILIRLVLAYVNDGQANDNHMLVSRYILENGHFPKSLDCFQCYHPKFFHLINANFWKLFNVQKPQSQFIVAQEFNAIAGIISIVFICLTINKFNFSKTLKVVILALIALNPRFIAINCQTSNDSFIILFGTLLIYYCEKFVNHFSIKYFFVLVIFSIFAGLTKTSSFILIAGITVSIIIKIIISFHFKNQIWRKYLAVLAVYCLVVPMALYYYGDFKENKANYGSYIVFNSTLGEMPNFLKKTNHFRPGIQSIVTGYFTFRLFDMLQNPSITNGTLPIPIHRTSFFSQLYGQSNFLYFDHLEPKNWICNKPLILNIGRIALILGLLPAAIMIIGFYKEFSFWAKTFFALKFKTLNENTNWVYSIFTIGFVFFIILYTLKGRDYSFLKIIFILPGVLAIVHPLLLGAEKVHQIFIAKKGLLKAFNLIIITLCISYLLPIFHLIGTLYLVLPIEYHIKPMINNLLF